MRLKALAQAQPRTDGWAWDAPSAEVQTGRPRVPQELIDEIQAGSRLASSTPGSFPPFMTSNKRPAARGKSAGFGVASSQKLGRTMTGTPIQLVYRPELPSLMPSSSSRQAAT